MPDLSVALSIAARVQTNIARVVIGKESTVELLLVALITGGHVLLEDVPGTGKTLLAKALARSIEATFRRIQFTPDLLPSDVTGVSIFNQQTGEFQFRPGPIFAQFVLADEVNRATPRTQSALLEAMEERQVTVDGVTRPLGEPFLVIATQNPVEQEGTFPLPEAQLDRFLLKLPAGYPDLDQEMAILDRYRSGDPYGTLLSVVNAAEIGSLRGAAPHIHISQAVQRYLVDVVRATRAQADVQLGVSPRGALALMRACQALALLRGRSYVLPDDVQYLAYLVLEHRMVVATQARLRGHGARQVLARILSEVPVPAEAVGTGRVGS